MLELICYLFGDPARTLGQYLSIVVVYRTNNDQELQQVPLQLMILLCSQLLLISSVLSSPLTSSLSDLLGSSLVDQVSASELSSVCAGYVFSNVENG